MRTIPMSTSRGLLLVALLAMVGSVHANAIFNVTLDTTALTTLPGSTAGPFALAFQLTDGGDASNNTATLSGFTFGGGSAGAGCPAQCVRIGGASGDIASTVILSDSDPFNAFLQTFAPGTSLSFLVDLTTNLDAGGTPDAFAFSILDGSGASIPTLDAIGADTLLSADISSASPAILRYATDPSRNTSNGVALTMGAPQIAPVHVPEPGSLALLGAGLLGLAGMGRLRFKR